MTLTLTMQLAIALWLISFTDAVAAGLAARQAFRIRTVTQNKTVFEWMTALGFGLALYSAESFFSVFLGILAGPARRSAWYFILVLCVRMIRTFGMWVVALTLLNGGTPSGLRRVVVWILGRFGVMDQRLVSPPSAVETKVDELQLSVNQLHETAAHVAGDLADSHQRADETQGVAGEAADAAAKSPTND